MIGLTDDGCVWKFLLGKWTLLAPTEVFFESDEEFLRNDGEIIYKGPDLSTEGTGAIIKAVDNTSLVAVKSGGMWFITAEARTGYSNEETADYFAKHGRGYEVVRSGNE